LMRMAFMLRDHADIREYLSDRFRYILIDEYQDTNRAQYIIAHTLAHRHQNICATGDPDQSIYRWRGADINNILDFEKDYPDAFVIRLEENYRSRKPILTAAAKLIAHNIDRKEKKLFTRKEGGADVKVILLDDEKAEAQYIADRVEQYRVNGGNYCDVAVFYRVNSQSRVIEDAFMKKGVPYKIARGTEFYNRKEIKDMLAYLKLLANPADDVSCERIINTPPRGIGATTINRLYGYAAANGKSLFDAARNAGSADLSNSAGKKVTVFAELISQLSASLDRPVRIIMEDVFRLSGLETMLSQKDEETRQARANVEELISAAADFDAERPDATLADYLQGVSLVSDTDHWEGSDGAVMLMTLHAAKGLEFPVVFIAGAEEQMLPFTREQLPGEMEDYKEIEEERRLAFVGITRAMEDLTITSARLRTVRGQRQPQQQSRFLDELGTEFISRHDKTTAIPASSSSHGGFYGGGFSSSLKKKIFDDDWSDFHEAMARSKQKRHFETATDDNDNNITFEECLDEFPIEYEGLQKGSSVSHPRFGCGKVTRISMPWPDTRVEVMFKDCGLKKLVLLHAKLKVL
ncbi:MAG TPA: 3'-5' exonuclease, partial [Phycisphaerae bacterium]|nr:3'-5' exonuclease [Phycisphaerae bacterium]